MLKVAILGAGFMGDTHGRAYQNIENADLVAVCDKDEYKGKGLAQKYNCEYYNDINLLLENCDCDILDICLPTFLHEESTILGAKYKKHIFCEKPVSLKMESLDNMLKAVKENKVFFMVGQVLRFWDEYVIAKKMYDRGELGELNYIFASRLSESPSWSEWYMRPENSGGGLFDLHLHDVDFLIWLLGRPAFVYATGKQNKLGSWNYVSTILSFENGTSAAVEGVIDMEKGYPFTMTLKLVGSKKTYDYFMEAGANIENIDEAISHAKVYDDGKINKLIVNGSDPHENELRHFINSVEKCVPSDVIPLEDLRLTLATMEAIKKSLETGEKVKVNY